jgi:hypothetical protein
MLAEDYLRHPKELGQARGYHQDDEPKSQIEINGQI